MSAITTAPTAEHILYSRGNVTVTPSRLLLRTRAYNLRLITSIHAGKDDTLRSLVVLAGVVLVALIAAIGGAAAQSPLLALVLGVAGLVLVLSRAWLIAPRSYVTLVTASGERLTLETSGDGGDLYAAVNRAMAGT